MPVLPTWTTLAAMRTALSNQGENLMPVSSYAPEFLEVWRRGSINPIEIRLDSKKEAERLRFRLNNLRKEMRKEEHNDVPLANGVQLSIVELKNGEAILTAHPSDDKFLDAIRAAGIEVEFEDPDDIDVGAPVSGDAAVKKLLEES